VNGKQQAVKLLGIYDWPDKHLRICFSGTQRPDTFIAFPGSGRVIQVWARTGQ
jgi:hypothetical protein